MQATITRFFYDHRYLLLLLCFTGLVFFKGITPSFSSDDFVHLENNSHFANLAEASEVFVTPFGREYRPLVRLSLWLNHLMDDSAIAYKISNLLMHLLCVVLLFGLLRRLGVGKTLALFSSSLFALHPIHTTSVHFILGRTDLVASVFYLATLYCTAGWHTSSSLIQRGFTLVWFVAALLSKELSISLAVMMLAVLWFQQGAYSVSAAWRIALRLWPYVLLTLIYLAARLYQWHTMSSAVAVYTDYSLKNILINYGEWVFALLYPFDLYVAREWQQLYPSLFITLVSAGAIGFLSLAVYLWSPAIKRLVCAPFVWLGILWILVTLLPMMGGNSHRWYLYLPSAGLSVLFAALWPLTEGFRRQLLAVVLGLIVAIYAGETLRQSLIWEKQSEINERLLSESATQALREHEAIAIANMPFGYQSAFLFTHSAFEEALRLRYGHSPRIEVLSYLNLDKENPLRITPSPEALHIALEPNAFRYVRMRNLQIFFDSPEHHRAGEFTLHIEQLDPAGRISAYRIEWSSQSKLPLYYFDGKDFVRVDTP